MKTKDFLTKDGKYRKYVRVFTATELSLVRVLFEMSHLASLDSDFDSFSCRTDGESILERLAALRQAFNICDEDYEG